ncbi:hypothetical protein [Aquipuribacter sp. SD81]|uniref:hypothetical protein n=1 Tax=Aquipuribacter sp. SD81 TaxID=3127703 RepID=UPI0030195640
MALMTTVRRSSRSQSATRVEADGFERAAADTADALDATADGLDVLVRRVLDCPDGVADDVIAEAVRGLEALGGGTLGETVGDARVLLQRRFSRALGRSGWTSGGA